CVGGATPIGARCVDCRKGGRLTMAAPNPSPRAAGAPAELPAEIAVGGSTGLDHESTAVIDEAARWLATTPRSQRGPAVGELRRRFGLSAVETCAAIREAGLLRA